MRRLWLGLSLVLLISFGVRLWVGSRITVTPQRARAIEANLAWRS